MTVLEFIDTRIEDVLSCPDLWGTPEAVENKLLTLLEIRHVAVGATLDVCNDTCRRFVRLTEEVAPGQRSLARKLGLHTLREPHQLHRASDDPRFVEVLRKFVRSEKENIHAPCGCCRCTAKQSLDTTRP